MSDSLAATLHPTARATAHHAAAEHHDHHHPVYDYDSGPPVERGKFAIWLFLATEVMFFSGLIGAYIVLRSASENWPDPAERLAIGITAFNTFVLITSSWMMVKSLFAAQKGDKKGIVFWLGLTILGGSCFVGIQVYEYLHLIHAGWLPKSDVFFSTFYITTGFHGMHVVVGVLWLICAWFKALRGGYHPRNYLGLELAGLYWHFVDLVWVLLFTIIYLF